MPRHLRLTLAFTLASTLAGLLLAGCAASHPSAPANAMHAAHAQPTVHAAHGDPAAHDATAAHTSAAPADDRTLVSFPPTLKAHTLANMRDHLAALADIQQALSEGATDRAADVAEQRLGMSSLHDHGAHAVARFMPPAMQAAGTAMHRSASRFALTARDAGATGDLRRAQAALAALTQTCVACHAGFRLQ